MVKFGKHNLDTLNFFTDAIIVLNTMEIVCFNQAAAEAFNLREEQVGCAISTVFSYDTNAFTQKIFRIHHGSHEYDACMIYDISPDSEHRALVVKSEHYLYREVFDASFDGILVTDANANVLMVNESYERITGIKTSSLNGKNMRDIYNLVWLKQSVAELVSEFKQPVTKRQITQLGSEIIVTGTPLDDENGQIKLIIINVRDIPEIYEYLEDELRRPREDGQNINLAVSPTKHIIVASEQLKQVYHAAKKVSNFQSTVLILGESGVGKEALAEYIHQNSIRKDKPFITINCGSIPNSLLESELFGYEKGAFTGALHKGKIGLLEAANGGTVFLDEIGEISPDFQVKLLRVLESKEIMPVGAVKQKIIDIRIVAATNRELKQMVKEGLFRADLYYRLNVIELRMPPLRDRIEDIRPLCLYYLKHFNKVYGQNKKLTPDTLKELERHQWPGNVRQLKNTIERTVLMSRNEYIQQYDLPWYSGQPNDMVNNLINEIMDTDKLSVKDALDALERQLYQNARLKYKTTREIAESLGVDQSTAVRKLHKYKL